MVCNTFSGMYRNVQLYWRTVMSCGLHTVQTKLCLKSVCFIVCEGYVNNKEHGKQRGDQVRLRIKTLKSICISDAASGHYKLN